MQAKSLVRTVTVIEVPAEALRLNEDLQALGRIRRELNWLDPASVAESSIDGRRILRWMQAKTRAAERYARDRLRREYLAPKKVEKKIQRKS